MTPTGVTKATTTRRGRLLRLVGSVLDPRAWAHAVKVANYFNYTNAAELRRAALGRGVIVSPTASFANGRNLVLGDRARVGAGASLWAGSGTARVVVGEDAMIAPNVMITAANYRFDDGAPIHAQLMDEADVVVGRDVWVGYGAIILPGVEVGEGAVVGAGAVVRSDVPPFAVVAGNPARVVGSRRRPGAAPEGPPAPLLPEALPGALEVLRLEARLEGDRLDRPLPEAGLDSFDLVTLRTALEAALGASIPDREWAAAATPRDLARLPSLARPEAHPAAHPVAPPPSPAAPPAPPTVPSPAEAPAAPGRSLRRLSMNMPQMALSGLGEPWLFKELGDVHWGMITDFLRVPSREIADEAGERLYSTFTRILLEVEPSLRGFRENDPLVIDSSLERHGASVFFARHRVAAPGSERGAEARATTMSTFARHGERGRNTSLVKGSPPIPDPDRLPSLPAMPPFGVEYRQRRAEEPEGELFACDYEILPPHDINGVGLLYFAAYPSIFDLCLERAEGRGFLLGHSTVSKDLCYFANSEPDEPLRFRLHAREEADGAVRHLASLYRGGDGKRMAEVRSVKRRA